MTDLFFSMHVCFFSGGGGGGGGGVGLTHNPTYKTNVFASVCVKQTFMFTGIC